MAAFGEVCAEHCDLDALIGSASSSPPAAPAPVRQGQQPSVRLGVALDAAFCFYYQDNLDLLSQAGAEIVPFSPLTEALPDVDGLYLGGGYPELHAGALSRSPCTREIRAAAADGLPVYAECGGLLYLCERLSCGEGDLRVARILAGAAGIDGRFQGPRRSRRQRKNE